MDRAKFFAAVRSPLFAGKLSDAQVRGIDAILDEAERRGTSLRHLAYMLATVFLETAKTMQPIAEYGKGAGRKYGVKGKYGQVPYGRGYVQLTWDSNYERADKELGLKGALLRNFNLAMRQDIAAKIMFEGMTAGWFTGRRLADYIVGDKADYVGARRIINGTDKAKTIAGHAAVFEAALKAGGYGTRAVVPAAGGFWAALGRFLLALIKGGKK
jgi:predicted chitinase